MDFEFAQLELDRVVRPCWFLSWHSYRVSADLVSSILVVQAPPYVFVDTPKVNVFFLRSLEVEAIVEVIFRLKERNRSAS